MKTNVIAVQGNLTSQIVKFDQVIRHYLNSDIATFDMHLNTDFEIDVSLVNSA